MRHPGAPQNCNREVSSKMVLIVFGPSLIRWAPQLPEHHNERLFVRGRELNTNFFLLNFSGTARISQQNPGISRPKRLVSLGFEGRTELSPPTRSRGRPPPYPKISGPKSLALASFFFPDVCCALWNVDRYLGNSCGSEFTELDLDSSDP